MTFFSTSEIRNSLYKDKSQQHSHNATPLGFGLSLSVPKDKSKNPPKQDESAAKKEVQEAASTLQTLGSTGSSNSGGDKPPNEISKVVKDVKMKDVKMKDVKRDLNLKSSNLKTSNLAEPTYRFCDRRRPGSSISISRRNYQMMKIGKTIHCWNSKFGSWMSVRILTDPKDDIRQKDDYTAESMDEPTMSNGLEQSNADMQGNRNQLDNAMDISLATTQDSVHSDQVLHLKENKRVNVSRGQPHSLRGKRQSCLSLPTRRMKPSHRKQATTSRRRKCSKGSTILGLFSNGVSNYRLRAMRKRNKGVDIFPNRCLQPSMEEAVFV